MAIKVTSTKDVAGNGVKVLTYSRAGVGKTKLSATAPKPIIISAEAGLLSLQDDKVDIIEVESVEDIMEAYIFLTESKDAEKYETICLDSLTEIAEVMITEYKSQEKDARQAYGRLNDDMSSFIRSFRDLKGKHVYFTAKEQRIVDDATGITTYMPGMPGKTLLNGLSFFFDEVFAMQIGRLEDGTKYRYLQTAPTPRYEAKDRSGRLDEKEEPNLTKIFAKIESKPTEKKEKK